MRLGWTIAVLMSCAACTSAAAQRPAPVVSMSPDGPCFVQASASGAVSATVKDGRAGVVVDNAGSKDPDAVYTTHLAGDPVTVYAYARPEVPSVTVVVHGRSYELSGSGVTADPTGRSVGIAGDLSAGNGTMLHLVLSIGCP